MTERMTGGMKDFAALLETLVLTPSRNAKIAAMAAYFCATPDPDRGIALAAITRDLSLANLKAGALRQLTMERVDPDLFLMSYDYVGDMAETISLIWPAPDEDADGELPGWRSSTTSKPCQRARLPAMCRAAGPCKPGRALGHDQARHRRIAGRCVGAAGQDGAGSL
ncbi:MAG: hypothetical protein CM15mP60_0300 [Alphaproteobacteria bacterium]|nr:MAG: hypothetical protein CM15mP60_0300 [Alphaproteobacteria bacterium]